MQSNTDRWQQLCEQAAREQDPRKLVELAREINNLLLFKAGLLSDVSVREVRPGS